MLTPCACARTSATSHESGRLTGRSGRTDRRIVLEPAPHPPDEDLAFCGWAWERHHNPLSWYIRPLFWLPFAFFAYRRSALGMVLTLLALATSMFWFPPPAHVDPQISRFLAA